MVAGARRRAQPALPAALPEGSAAELPRRGCAHHQLTYRVAWRAVCTQCLTPAAHRRVREVIAAVLANAGAVLDDYEGGPGHVVATLTAPPTADLPGLIATLKRASARWLRSHGAELLAGPAPSGLQFWDRNYVIRTVGEWVQTAELLHRLEPPSRDRRRPRPDPG